LGQRRGKSRGDVVGKEEIGIMGEDVVIYIVGKWSTWHMMGSERSERVTVVKEQF
jgi:hypothetical protein